MHDVMRKRLWRKLEGMPDEQLYQVLDYIEFLEAKYGRSTAPAPGGLQRFAERLEDRMRLRSLAPSVMGTAMNVVGTAGRVLDGIAGAGRELIAGFESSGRPASDRATPAQQRPPERPDTPAAPREPARKSLPARDASTSSALAAEAAPPKPRMP